MRKRSKLKRYEYQEIFEKYFDLGWSQAEIASYTGRSTSTISRALKRDLHPSPFLTTFEKAMHAFECSRARMRASRRRKRLKSDRIRKIVQFLLCRWEWSPESISGFLGEHGVPISAKAIYNFIKFERPELKKYLYQRGKVRRQRVRHRRGMFRAGVPAKRSIHERPELSGDGDWEIDTVLSGRSGSGAVLTLRQLASKKRFYFLLPNLKASSVMEILFSFFQSLPPYMRSTLTADNGSEFAELYKLEQ
ncbi:hypothetical protein BVY02_01955, partial [bacterium J17]